MIVLPSVRLSIVAPMHNEAGNVEPLYENIHEVMEKLAEPYEIVFVNDGSTDETLAMMKGVQKRDPRFHYSDLAFNVGENWALLAGISKASGDIVVTIDGDYQNDPADIPRLLQRLDEGYSVVSGRRKNRRGNFWLRRLPSYVANTMIRFLTGIPVHDCGCGLKAYRREVLKGKFVPKGFMNRFSPAVFGVKPHQFSEVEVRDRARKSGGSHYGIGRVFVVFRDLLTLPFAIRGTEKWLSRFYWLQWLFSSSSLVLAVWSHWISAALLLLAALGSFSNAKNLRRFLEAERAPRFQIGEFR